MENSGLDGDEMGRSNESGCHNGEFLIIDSSSVLLQTRCNIDIFLKTPDVGTSKNYTVSLYYPVTSMSPDKAEAAIEDYYCRFTE